MPPTPEDGISFKIEGTRRGFTVEISRSGVLGGILVVLDIISAQILYWWREGARELGRVSSRSLTDDPYLIAYTHSARP